MTNRTSWTGVLGLGVSTFLLSACIVRTQPGGPGSPGVIAPSTSVLRANYWVPTGVRGRTDLHMDFEWNGLNSLVSIDNNFYEVFSPFPTSRTVFAVDNGTLNVSYLGSVTSITGNTFRHYQGYSGNYPILNSINLTVDQFSTRGSVSTASGLFWDFNVSRSPLANGSAVLSGTITNNRRVVLFVSGTIHSNGYFNGSFGPGQVGFNSSMYNPDSFPGDAGVVVGDGGRNTNIALVLLGGIHIQTAFYGR